MTSWMQRAAQPQRAAIVLAVVTLVLSSAALFHAGGSFADARDGVSPLTLLGTKADMTDCVTAPLEIGAGTTVCCPTWDGVRSQSGEVRVVSLHAVGDSTIVEPWLGALPAGLAWGDSIADVVKRLEKPDRITAIYGTPTFVYMFRTQPFGSLELRFDEQDRLASLNASVYR